MFRGKPNFKNQEKVVEQRAGGEGKFGKSASLLLQVVIDFVIRVSRFISENAAFLEAF